jgi:hypothetical protein
MAEAFRLWCSNPSRTYMVEIIYFSLAIAFNTSYLLMVETFTKECRDRRLHIAFREEENPLPDH